MKILYIGDIMAEPGQKIVEKILPKFKQKYQVDFVIAQAENIDEAGKGPGHREIERMQKAGVDFFSGGNHSLLGKNSKMLYEDGKIPIIRPANLKTNLGKGWKIVETQHGKILIVSILGQTVGSNKAEIENPLETIDRILNALSNEHLAASIINFHGDFSSEKRVFGYYVDGRISAVIGDHWHVPTADAMILPGGTAHITDVGMCGTLHSSLGVKTSVISERWKTGKSSRNEIEQAGPLQFNAVLLDISETTNFPRTIEHIQQIIE
jgi:metallophosphoesterase (TIGR00282 family)